jgi:hypothetical protein
MPTQRLSPLLAREYKLLLDFDHFGPTASIDTANAFWKKKLKPAIASSLDKRENGEGRAEGDFEQVTERTIQFWDTKSCILTRSKYALRTRIHPPKSKEPGTEITLKLRMPDMFVVGTAQLSRRKNQAPDFEEDIAPLEVARGSGKGKAVVLAKPRSRRSQFSMSATRATNATPSALGDVYKLFSALKKRLADCGDKADAKTPLVCGPVIQETVYKGAKVKLGGNIEGKFSLTVWRFSSRKPVPGIAEISFKCETQSGFMPADAAGRAFALFTGLQDKLGDLIDASHSSKTALALPAGCGR